MNGRENTPLTRDFTLFETSISSLTRISANHIGYFIEFFNRIGTMPT